MDQNIKNPIINKLFAFLQKLNFQRHIHSIRISFIALMPIMMAGAYAVLINNLPIGPYQKFMEEFFGESWKNFGSFIFNATIQFTTLFLVFAIGANLSKWYKDNKNINTHPNISGMVALASYIIMNLETNSSSISFSSTGVTGIFAGIIVAVLACELFIYLSTSKMVLFYVNYDPDIEVPAAFVSIIPFFLTVFIFTMSRSIIIAIGVTEGLNDMINYFLSLPYRFTSPTIKTSLIYNISSHFMWLFGIHGNNVLDNIAKVFFESPLVAPGQILSKTFLDVFVYMGGSGVTLGLLLSLFVFGKNKSYRTLFKFALPNSIFNINEPLIFGIPIVLNPIYAIPFILAPCIMLFTSYFALKSSLLPPIVNEVSWSTPVFISGYIATNSISGSILQLFNLIIATLIYTPFVKLADKLSEIQFKGAYGNLVELVTNDYSSTHDLLTRADSIGAISRQLSNEMETALKRGDMFLNYQPIVDVRGHKLEGVEALLRWKHPIYGMINPMIIIALAEENNLIDKLGLWIIETAISQKASWTKEGIKEFKISINISWKQLNSPSFYMEVLGLLKRYNVSPNQLKLEVTETIALVQNKSTTNNINKLNDAGIGIVMDDFGVGHSSLIYLRTMPISTLKIDGSLSKEILNHPANLKIISTIYDLCKLMEITTVVEFVDSQEQLDKLMEIGDFLIQGYLFSPPLPGNELFSFINTLTIN